MGAKNQGGWRHQGAGQRYWLGGLILLVGAVGCQLDPIDRNGDSVRASQPIISDSIVDLDLTANGSYPVFRGEYRLPAEEDSRIFSGLPTEVRAAVSLPEGAGPFPLLIFLHGNHGTCGRSMGADRPRDDSGVEYTIWGKCPDGSVEVPSYLGYEYAATHLASHGYAVVSINANRGLTAAPMGYLGAEAADDPMLIVARAKMVLKHLEQLARWTRGEEDSRALLGVSLEGQLDFEHVGFMGHSRGGEAVRSAYELYRRGAADSFAAEIGEMTVEGIFEFAPVDLSTAEPFDAPGVDWTVVIAACDGDVSRFNGTGTFRRRREANGRLGAHHSSIFVVPGANHNFFNTEWQETDSAGCLLGAEPLWSGGTAVGSGAQRKIGLMTLSAFFRGFVGAYPRREDFQHVFDPQYRVPAELAGLVDPVRESLRHEIVEVVEQAPSSGGTVGLNYRETGVDVDVAGTNRELVEITWNRPDPSLYYDAVLWEGGADLSDKWLISFSLARFALCDNPWYCDGEEALLDLGIQLLFASGDTSESRSLADYVSVTSRLNSLRPCPPPFEPARDVRSICVAPRLGYFRCYAADGYFTEQGCTLGRQVRYLLFQEVPIELADFGATDLRQVVGLRFTFDRSAPGSILVDKEYAVRAFGSPADSD